MDISANGPQFSFTQPSQTPPTKPTSSEVGPGLATEAVTPKTIPQKVQLTPLETASPTMKIIESKLHEIGKAAIIDIVGFSSKPAQTNDGKLKLDVWEDKSGKKFFKSKITFTVTYNGKNPPSEKAIEFEQEIFTRVEMPVKGSDQEVEKAMTLAAFRLTGYRHAIGEPILQQNNNTTQKVAQDRIKALAKANVLEIKRGKMTASKGPPSATSGSYQVWKVKVGTEKYEIRPLPSEPWHKPAYCADVENRGKKLQALQKGLRDGDTMNRVKSEASKIGLDLQDLSRISSATIHKNIDDLVAILPIANHPSNEVLPPQLKKIIDEIQTGATPSNPFATTQTGATPSNPFVSSPFSEPAKKQHIIKLQTSAKEQINGIRKQNQQVKDNLKCLEKLAEQDKAFEKMHNEIRKKMEKTKFESRMEAFEKQCQLLQQNKVLPSYERV